MREKDVEKKLVDGVRKLGGRAYKWVSPGNAGVPDRIVFLPGGRVYFVELKTDAGQLSAVQTVQTRRLRELGAEVHLVKGEAGVAVFLDEVCNGQGV